MEKVTRRTALSSGFAATAAAFAVSSAEEANAAQRTEDATGKDVLMSVQIKGLSANSGDALKDALIYIVENAIYPTMEDVVSVAPKDITIGPVTGIEGSSKSISIAPKDLDLPFKGVSVCVGT